MKTRVKTLITIFFASVLLFGGIVSENVSATSTNEGAEEYNLTFSVTPDPIKSKSTMILTTKVNASADALPNPAELIFRVPKDLVSSSSMFANQQSMPESVKFKQMVTDGTDYIVTYTIDKTKWTQVTTLQLQLSVPQLLTGIAKTEYTLTATLGDKMVSETVKTETGAPVQPYFSKSKRFSNNTEGQGLLDFLYPMYNGYDIIFNKDHSRDYTNVTISDVLPEGTQIYYEYGGQSTINGNRSVQVDGIRVYTFTMNANGDPNGVATYVTDQYLDKITYDETTRTIQVNLGDVPKDVGFVVQYAVQVLDPSLGTYVNRATVNNTQMGRRNATTTEVIKTGNSAEAFLKKTVNKEVAKNTEKELIYTFKIGGDGFAFPAGTTILDYLPTGVHYSRLVNDANDSVGVTVTDDMQTVTIETKRALDIGEVIEISFAVDLTQYESDQIVNIGYIQLDGLLYYTNVAKTKIIHDSAIKIIKIDSETEEPLAGATFSIYDGTTMIGSVTTGDAGEALYTNIELNKKYTLVETQAPTGYILATEIFEFELTEGNNYIAELIIANTLDDANDSSDNNSTDNNTSDNNSSSNNSSDNNSSNNNSSDNNSSDNNSTENSSSENNTSGNNVLPVTGQSNVLGIGAIILGVGAVFVYLRKRINS